MSMDSPSSTSAAAQVTLVTIDESSEGQRLDNFLLRILKGVPKTHVYRIIRAGEVRVNKGRAQADTRLALGDVVRVPPVRVSDKIAQKADKPAPARSFPILLEDDYLLAIDKPAGIAVHGGSGVSFGVIEQLRRARPEAKFLELVHRLDKETSGVLLIAKRRSALVHLQAQFKNRETGKTYLAVVKGLWPAKLKVIDQPLHKYVATGGEEDGERRVKVVAKDDPNGMRAITLVKVVQNLLLPGGQKDGQKGDRSGAKGTSIGAGKGTAVGTSTEASLLEVTIKTGRTHQIRVHLASHGHPIVGDEKYGDFELNKQLAKLGHKRMYLHAWRLGFTHPASAQEVTLESVSPFTMAAQSL
jgi:23S rRNA pseudouridine955/2504/2580 synthase